VIHLALNQTMEWAWDDRRTSQASQQALCLFQIEAAGDKSRHELNCRRPAVVPFCSCALVASPPLPRCIASSSLCAIAATSRCSSHGLAWLLAANWMGEGKDIAGRSRRAQGEISAPSLVSLAKAWPPALDCLVSLRPSALQGKHLLSTGRMGSSLAVVEGRQAMQRCSSRLLHLGERTSLLPSSHETTGPPSATR
jgi:hypothetical protein